MYLKKIIIFIIFISTILQINCASVPPEFITSMETERNGIALLEKRHRQTVNDLVENWYVERFARLIAIKEQELKKITVNLPNPEGGAPLEVIEKESLLKIEKQFDEAIALINKTRMNLIEGFLDSENWNKLIRIHDVNLDMAKSLLELNEAQRKFYSTLVGNNMPFPTDFINEKTKDVLNKVGLNK